MYLVTKPRETWPLAAEAAFDTMVAAVWALKGDPTLAEGISPVPHGAPVPAVVAYVGAAMAYERCYEADSPDPQLVLLDSAYCAKLQRHNGEVCGARQSGWRLSAPQRV